MAVSARDEDIHPRGEGEYYLENYLFGGLSSTSDVGFYIHISRMFEIGVLEVHAVTFDGTTVASCLERHDLSETGMNTDSFSYEIVEPLHEWRLRYASTGRAGAFIGHSASHSRRVEFDVVLRGEVPPFDMAEAFRAAGFGGLGGQHYEQGFSWHGTIRIGDETLETAGLGLRDHSWGKRHMTEHNTTWWCPAVFTDGSFYTGLNIRRSARQLSVASHSDATGSRTFPSVDVQILKGDQVTYHEAEIRYGDEPPLVAHGIVKVPMPWLIGQGLPRLSDDLFCRVTSATGLEGFALVEMSRAATEAEQFGFGPAIDTRTGAAARPARSAGPGPAVSRDLTARLRGLSRQFPVDWSGFYSRNLPEHVARVVITTMLVDAGRAAEIDAMAVTSYRSVLCESRGLLEAHDRHDLAAEVTDALKRVEGPDAWRSIAGRVIAAFPVTDYQLPDLEHLRRSLAAIEATASQRCLDAYQSLLGEQRREPAAVIDDSVEFKPTIRVIGEILERRLGAAPGCARGAVATGGLSKVTLLYTIGDRKLIVRADRGAQYSGAPVAEEYQTIATVHAAGVPVPRPVLFEDALDGRHPAFSVVDWVDGQPIGGVPAFRDAALCRRLAEILAAIHAVPPERFSHLPGWNSTIPDRQLAALDIREREWRAAGAANPVVEYALHWLRANITASDGPHCLVHGDFRPHNVLGVDREVTAVLDWEHSKIGAAAEDLAYFRPAAEALSSWDEFLDAYTGAGGRMPTADQLRYYEVLASVFNISILDQMELEYSGRADQPLSMIGTVLHYRPLTQRRLAERLGLAT